MPVGMKKLIVSVAILVTLSVECTKGYKILIWPAEFSHWYNLKVIADRLATNGHQVNVLRSSAYQDFMKNETGINFVDFQVDGVYPGDHLKSMDQILYSTKLGPYKAYTITAMLSLVKFSLRQMEMRLTQCHSILQNEQVLTLLSRGNFDLMLADASVPCGEIIAAKLELPLVYSVRTLPAELQYYLSETPMPLSYVPMINTASSDRMNFFERLHNVAQYVYQLTFMRTYMKLVMDPIVAKYYDSEVTYAGLMRRAKAWLIRTDFAFEYPRPTMPNLHFIGGFHCKLPSPLISKINKIANNNDYGFIVFSMGSMVRSMHETKAAKFASAFARLKYTVFWRYADEAPQGLGNNTHILNWLPQNDLLAHKNCKVFITHGGTNGLYEAIFHGVPVLGFPLLVDQFDNMRRMEDRGIGLSLDINEFDDQQLETAIERIVSDLSFKTSAIRLSKIHRDTAISPLDSAVFWIEHTIRNKDSNHLISASHELSFISFYLLDVLVYVIATVGLSIYLLLRMRKVIRGQETSKNLDLVVPRNTGIEGNENVLSNGGIHHKEHDITKRRKQPHSKHSKSPI